MKKYVLFVIIAIIVIAIFSNMTYEQQTIVPELETMLADKPFEAQLSKLHFTYWGKPISVEERGYFYFVEFIVRKATHFFGYGVVAAILYGFYRKLHLNFAALFAISSIFVVACLDEWRQSFIPGRTGIFNDALIDTAGAVFVITVVKIFMYLYQKTRVRN